MFAEKRIVSLLRTNNHEPSINPKNTEALNRHLTNRTIVDKSGRPIHKNDAEMFENLNPEIDSIMGGIRDNVSANLNRYFPDVNAVNQVVDEATVQRLKIDVIAPELKAEYKTRGFIGKALSNVWDLYRNVRSVLREHSDPAGKRLERHYDPDNSFFIPRFNRVQYPVRLNEMNLNAARQVVNGLNVNEINTLITNPIITAAIPANVASAGRQAIISSLAEIIAGLSYDNLVQLRQTARIARFGVPNTLRFSDKIDPTNKTAFERLLDLKEVSVTTIEKVQKPVVFNTQRLQDVLDNQIRVHSTHIDEPLASILKENQLYPLEGNADAKALIYHLEKRINHQRQTTPNSLNNTPEIQLLAGDLNSIFENLPNAKLSDEANAKHKANIEQAKNLSKGIENTMSSLNDIYIDGATLGPALFNANKQLLIINEQINLLNTNMAAFNNNNNNNQQGNTQNNNPFITPLNTALTKQKSLEDRIQQLEDNVSKNFANIRKHEQKLKDSISKLQNFIATLTPRVNIPLLAQIAQLGAIASSTQYGVYGDTTPPPGLNTAQLSAVQYALPANQSPLKLAVETFNVQSFEQLSKEFDKEIKPENNKERIDCRTLLSLLIDRELFRDGFTPPENRIRQAWVLSSCELTKAKDSEIALSRAMNNQVSSRLGEAVFDTFDTLRVGRTMAKIKKFTKKSFESRENLSGNDVIRILSGNNKEFAVFREMPLDISLNELRHRFSMVGGMKAETIFEFREELKAAIIGFNLKDSKDKLNVFDRHSIALERIVDFLNLLYHEEQSATLFRQLREKKITKTEAIVKELELYGDSLKKTENELENKVFSDDAEWKKLMFKKELKILLLDKYKAALRHMDENQFDSERFNKYLRDEGLLTVHDEFKNSAYLDLLYEKSGQNANRAYYYVRDSWVVQKSKAAAKTTASVITWPFRAFYNFNKKIAIKHGLISDKPADKPADKPTATEAPKK